MLHPELHNHLGYKSTSLDGLSSRMTRVASAKAMCVITTEDDMVLARHYASDGRQALVIPNITIATTTRFAESLITSNEVGHFLGSALLGDINPDAAGYLGSYRYAPPRNKQMLLPTYVELDFFSDEIDMPATTMEWVELEEAEEIIVANQIKEIALLNSRAQDSHYALAKYLDMMTHTG